jgi:hypothetical protein
MSDPTRSDDHNPPALTPDDLSPAEAIALAQQCGIYLTEDDLKQAAIAAESVNGFSFEKLWFRRLKLLG